MSTVNQVFVTDYISEEQVKTLSAELKEPEWLLNRRIKAFNQFLNLEVDQDNLFYKYTNFKGLKLSDLKPYWESDEVIAINPENAQFETISVDIVETPNSIALVNENIRESGAVFTTLHNLIKENEELAQKIVSKVDESSGFDKLGELAKAFATNIVILYVPRNTKVNKTLFRNILLGETALSVFSEFIVYLEESAEVEYFEYYRSVSKTDSPQLYLTSQTFILDDNSRLRGLQSQDWNSNVIHIGSKLANINSYAYLNVLHHFQGGQLSRFNSGIKLLGKGAEGYDLFNSFGANKQRFDVKSELSHIGESSIGQTHSRTVMMDKAESVLRGLIHIPETGINADSYLASNGLTVGKGKVIAVPALQIDQNDVVAGHAASVEPLNEDKVFYIQSRGVTKETAKALLVKGYFEPVTKLLGQEDLQEIVRLMLAQKWEQSK